MRFELYTDAALTRDMPELGLRCGDVVKLIEHHTAPDGGEGYSIEVFNAVGETLAVTTVPPQRSKLSATMKFSASNLSRGLSDRRTTLLEYVA